MYLINDSGVGISSKIKNDKERKKLNKLVSDFITENKLTHGLIVRTITENVSEDILIADLERLLKLWRSIEKKFQSKKAGNCVFEELPLPARVLRDLPAKMVKNIWIDSEKDFQILKQYIDNFLPDNESNILFYDGDVPIFEKFNIEHFINSSLNRAVSLPSGGGIIFDYTEAIEEDNWWTRFKQWVNDVWSSFIRWIFGGDEVSGTASFLIQLLPYLIVASLVALLVWVFLKMDSGQLTF